MAMRERVHRFPAFGRGELLSRRGVALHVRFERVRAQLFAADVAQLLGFGGDRSRVVLDLATRASMLGGTRRGCSCWLASYRSQLSVIAAPHEPGPGWGPGYDNRCFRAALSGDRDEVSSTTAATASAAALARTIRRARLGRADVHGATALLRAVERGDRRWPSASLGMVMKPKHGYDRCRGPSRPWPSRPRHGWRTG